MQFTTIIIYSLFPFISAIYLYKEIKEIIILKKKLKKILNKNTLQTKEDFVKLKIIFKIAFHTIRFGKIKKDHY